MTLVLCITFAVTAWLAWAAAINMPLMPDGMVRAEGMAWPLAILLASAGFAAATLLYLNRQPRWLVPSTLILATLTAGLALRVTILPLLPTVSPLTLIGFREILALFTLLYLGCAAFAWKRS